MTTRAVIQRMERPNGEGYVEFVRGEDGHYRFVQYKKDCDPGYKPFFWQRFVSGIYDDLGAAERDAQMFFPWLLALIWVPYLYLAASATSLVSDLALVVAVATFVTLVNQRRQLAAASGSLSN